MRVELPESIQNSMSLWRAGLDVLPDSYIEFHRELAELEVDNLREAGYDIVSTRMESDGWMDSMKVLHVFALTPKDKMPIYLRWHDGGQNFMKRSSGGCWIRFDK